MSAEQTPDIADLAAEEFERHMSLGTSGRWILDYGMTPDSLAAALAPVLAAAVREAEQRALRDFAVCICDQNAEHGLTPEARHFGRTYGNLARDRADRVAEPQHEAATSGKESEASDE